MVRHAYGVTLATHYCRDDTQRYIDGPTLEIHGTRIGLYDLETFIARRPVNRKTVSEDEYWRTVATGSIGGADPLNGLFTMVSRWIGR